MGTLPLVPPGVSFKTWSSSHGAPGTPRCSSQISRKACFLGMRVMGDVGMGEASGAVTRGHGDTGTGHVLGPCLLVGIKPFPDPAAPRDHLGSRVGRVLSLQPPRIPSFPQLSLPELSQGSAVGMVPSLSRMSFENLGKFHGNPERRGSRRSHRAWGLLEKPLPMVSGIHGAWWEGGWRTQGLWPSVVWPP